MPKLITKALRGFSRALGIETPEDLDQERQTSGAQGTQSTLWDAQGHAV
jgi:hypothetical protein